MSKLDNHVVNSTKL